MRYLKTYESDYIRKKNLEDFSDFLFLFIASKTNGKFRLKKEYNSYEFYWKKSETYHICLFSLIAYNYEQFEYTFYIRSKIAQRHYRLFPDEIKEVLEFINHVMKKFFDFDNYVSYDKIPEIEKYIKENFEIYKSVKKYNL